MSIEDPSTRFLDALYAWHQAGEPASGDEVTAVQIDPTSVHKAYHQLDQVLQNESAVQWSHFLQACQIRPRRSEWVWQAIEDLTVQLGYDVMFFEAGPEPAAEPEPEELEERAASTRDVKWAKRVYYLMHEDVHGYRPDGVAAVTKDMDEVQRFLAQLGAIVVSLPALRTPGSAPPSGESLPGLEKGIKRLFRYHDALPEADKEAIEREWTELASAIYNYTEARQYLRSLYKRMADKLGHSDTAELEDATTAPLHKVDGQTRLAVVRAGSDSGEVTVPGEGRVQVRQSRADRGDAELVALPTLPAAQGEPAVAGPAPLPDEESRRWHKKMTRRVGAIGGTIVAVAAVVMFVLLPEPQPVPETSPTVTERATIEQLPLEEFDYPVCESPVQARRKSDERQAIATPARPAATLPVPKRRKASKLQFVKDTDSVVIRRTNKPNLMVTVTEVSDEGVPIKKAKKSRRVHTIEAKEFTGFGLSVGMSEGYQLAVEPTK